MMKKNSKSQKKDLKCNGTCGIYRIYNTKNDKIYIGSSKNLKSRKKQHFLSLKNNVHYCKEMQNDFNFFGEENFYFEVIITCDKEYLLYYEQQIIDGITQKYNSSPTAGSQLGFRHNQETKDKISKMKKGIPTKRRPTDKMIENLIMRNIGNVYPAKTYKGFISPNGECVNEIFNLNAFCRENNLDCAHMTDVYYGKRKSHKGWTNLENKNIGNDREIE